MKKQILFFLLLQSLFTFSQNEILLRQDGVVFPRMTSAQRTALDAVKGQCIYNTDFNNIECYDGTDWKLSVEQASRTATFVVCACDAKDTRQCDFLADGIADDVEIQAAIDSLPGSKGSSKGQNVGGVVLLSEGNFNISNPIVINKPRVVLTGQGKLVTRLDPIKSFGANPVIKLQGQNELEVRNLAITDPNDTSESIIGIDITSTTSTVLSNLWFGGLTNGTAIQVGSSDGAAAGFLIQGVYIESSNKGIIIERECQSGRLIGVQVFKCGTGLEIKKNNGAVPKNLSIATSSFLQNRQGIIVNGASFLSFSNIMVYDNELYGMRLGESDLTADIAIAASVFQQNGSDTMAANHLRTGLYIDSNATRVTCENCMAGNREEVIHRRQNYGFLIKGTDNRVLGSTSHNHLIKNVAIDEKAIGSKVRNTIGFISENQGTITFSSNGLIASFSIPHGLSNSPESWSVTPVSVAACEKFYVTADSINLQIHFIAAPPKGTNNIAFAWRAWTPESGGNAAADASSSGFLINESSNISSPLEQSNSSFDMLSPILKKSNSGKQQAVSPTLSLAKLEQNYPNPFHKSTAIRYHLPEKFDKAFIIINELNGSNVRRFSIDENGHGTLHIEAGLFHAGSYFYSLLVDGKLIDTKQMVLTR